MRSTVRDFSPLATISDRISGSGTTAWYLTDRLGSVRDITDNTGAVIDHINYDGFGNVTQETQSSNGDRWKWTGRELDSETGLQYNRARSYDPKTGRWTSQDPLGFAGGDGNLYRYAMNGPTISTDPTGLGDFPILGLPADIREKMIRYREAVEQARKDYENGLLPKPQTTLKSEAEMVIQMRQLLKSQGLSPAEIEKEIQKMIMINRRVNEIIDIQKQADLQRLMAEEKKKQDELREKQREAFKEYNRRVRTLRIYERKIIDGTFTDLELGYYDFLVTEYEELYHQKWPRVYPKLPGQLQEPHFVPP